MTILNALPINFTSAGITTAIPVEPALVADSYVLVPDVSTPTMLGNIIITFTGTPAPGTRIIIGITPVILGANTFTIDGVSIPAWVALSGGNAYLFYADGGWSFDFYVNQGANGKLSGAVLIDGTVSVDKLESGTDGQIVAYNSANLPKKLTVAGALTAAASGATLVFSIAAGIITNAMINASAAIAWSKMATLTASKVVVTSIGGVITTANQLSAALGGLAADFSAATGFTVWTAGSASAGALTDVRHLDNISFVTAQQGLYSVYFPFACTVTNINIRVTSVVAGTDDGSLTIANNAGTVMTGSSLTAGVLTVAASAAFGTGYSSTLTTNNTFTAGQTMKITSSKTTSGGVVSADITFTRTGLV